jgi:hypothetical protein
MSFLQFLLKIVKIIGAEAPEARTCAFTHDFMKNL